MYITEVSIRRPVVSWVMSLILIVFGIFVFWKLPVRELPSGIQPPVVQVQVDYKSAAASIVDQEVTQVVEDVIGGAEGIKTCLRLYLVKKVPTSTKHNYLLYNMKICPGPNTSIFYHFASKK